MTINLYGLMVIGLPCVFGLSILHTNDFKTSSMDPPTVGQLAAKAAGVGKFTAQQQQIGKQHAIANVVGQIMAQEQGVGKVTAAAQGSGKIAATREGIGKTVAETEGIGQETAHLEGVGKLVAVEREIGKSSALSEGSGKSTAEADRVGRAVAQAEGVGKVVAQTEGAGKATAQTEGIGQTTAQLQGSGRVAAEAQGSGHEAAKASLVGQQTAKSQGVGRRAAEIAQIGHLAAVDANLGKRTAEQQGVGRIAAAAQGSGKETAALQVRSSCKPASPTMRDPGYPDFYRGWYDIQGCGRCNDYCRWVGVDGMSGGDPRKQRETERTWWSCRMAGTSDTYTPRGAFQSWNFSRCAFKGQKFCLPPSTNNQDDGFIDNFRGWYDLQGCGTCNDYCRWVGGSGPGGDPAETRVYADSYWSCRLAGSSDSKTPPGYFNSWSYTRCAVKHEKSCLPPSTSLLDEGYIDDFRGWYDLQGCGTCNDYCRWVGFSGSGGDPGTILNYKKSWWSCRLAGTHDTHSTPLHFNSSGFPYKKCNDGIGIRTAQRLHLGQAEAKENHIGAIEAKYEKSGQETAEADKAGKQAPS